MTISLHVAGKHQKGWRKVIKASTFNSAFAVGWVRALSTTYSHLPSNLHQLQSLVLIPHFLFSLFQLSQHWLLRPVPAEFPTGLCVPERDVFLSNSGFWTTSPGKWRGLPGVLGSQRAALSSALQETFWHLLCLLFLTSELRITLQNILRALLRE